MSSDILTRSLKPLCFWLAPVECRRAHSFYPLSFLLAALALGSSSPGIAATNPPASGAKSSAALTQLPAYFEPADDTNPVSPSFLARFQGGRLYLRPDGAALSHFVAGKKRSLRMHLAGARAPVSLEGLDRQIGVINDYSSSDPTRWRTGKPMFSKVKYPDVYPGADLLFYTGENSFEYDIVLHPGDDPSAIALQFDSATQKPACRANERRGPARTRR